MAIHKLRNLYEIIGGSTPNTKIKELWEGNIKFYTPYNLSTPNSTYRFISKMYKKWEKPNTLMLTTRAPIGIVAFSKEFFWFSQGIKVFKNMDKNKILDKWFYYWILKNTALLNHLGTGTTFLELSKSELQEIQIDIPALDNQKIIIDIIEPLEEAKNRLVSLLEIFSKYTESIMEESIFLEKLNKNCSFLKGESVTNYPEGRTLFLNVAAANGNENKYCDNDPNIFPRDITLSLDGNTGLVNNNLLGFNGYLYKVESKSIPNWQIYYSLKHKMNQTIIKINETGTTIKHSSNSKKELLLLEFKEKEVLKSIFDLELNLKSQINMLNKQIELVINLLVK